MNRVVWLAYAYAWFGILSKSATVSSKLGQAFLRFLTLEVIRLQTHHLHIGVLPSLSKLLIVDAKARGLNHLQNINALSTVSASRRQMQAVGAISGAVQRRETDAAGYGDDASFPSRRAQ